MTKIERQIAKHKTYIFAMGTNIHFLHLFIIGHSLSILDAFDTGLFSLHVCAFLVYQSWSHIHALPVRVGIICIHKTSKSPESYKGD